MDKFLKPPKDKRFVRELRLLFLAKFFFIVETIAVIVGEIAGIVYIASTIHFEPGPAIIGAVFGGIFAEAMFYMTYLVITTIAENSIAIKQLKEN